MDIKMCADVSRQPVGEHLGGGVRDQQTGRDQSFKLFLTYFSELWGQHESIMLTMGWNCLGYWQLLSNTDQGQLSGPNICFQSRCERRF